MAKDSWNPFFRALYEHCSAKPQAVEDHPWGDTVFKIRGKVFAFLGHPEHGGVTVKASPDELDSLLALSFIRRSAYIGRYGWVSVEVENDDALDLALRLIDQSYDLIVSKTRSASRKGRRRKRDREEDADGS
jgi:predicted DNA-binding protein (MmcQ/YjbR family)